MAENQNIEWKAIWKDEYLAWICGFANAQGGKLFIGVDDEGQPVGLQNSGKLMEDLPNKIKGAMGIIVDINLHQEDENEYIEISVPAYPVAISCKGFYYYRSGSTNQKLSGTELETFIMRRRGVNWESSPMPQLNIEDIDEGIIRYFKEKAAEKGRLEENVLDESKEYILEKLHLKNGDFLTHAAALLFSPQPERWFLGAYIKVGFFESDADLLYQDEVHGSLLQQVDKTMELIYFKYFKAKISYKGIQRIERYPYPEAALREALLNAIVHKDYRIGIPIQISVYDDKLYIANVGKLPEMWTFEHLMNKHASRPFNPNIAHAFYLAGFIESWGRGIEKIYDACRKDGLPDPEYTIHPGDIMIKFTAPEDRIIRYRTQNEGVVDHVVDHVVEVLSLIRETPEITTKQMTTYLPLSERQVQRIIKRLRDSNEIRRIGSDRQGHWEIID